jgi:cysteine-rich repeat protein
VHTARTATILGLTACLSATPWAAGAEGREGRPGNRDRHGREDRHDRQLVVTSVFADTDAEQLTIYGRHLAGHRAPRVSLAGVELEVLSFDPFELLTSLPPAIAPGSHLLKVQRRGRGERGLDLFEVTLGAVGPEGEPGPRGEPGPQGLPGNLALANLHCPQGLFVSGFDTGGGLVCSDGSPLPAVCGNGALEAGEECDDGNLVDGDGCSASCSLEVPIVTEHQITNTPDTFENWPRLGQDGSGNLLVYTSHEFAAALQPGRIVLQRLSADGRPQGAAVELSRELTNDILGDVSGSRVIYSAFMAVGSDIGQVMLADAGDPVAPPTPLSEVVELREGRIHGFWATWVQGDPTVIMLYNVNLQGTTVAPFQISNVDMTPGQPPPPAIEVEIGSDFVVWEESGTAPHEVWAWELRSHSRHVVSAGGDSRHPATGGSLVVWEEHTATGSEIRARDMATKTDFTVAADGGVDYVNPSVYVDPGTGAGLIGYESGGAVFVHRLPEGDTFPVTDASSSQFVNDVFGDLLAYADDRNPGTVDIFVAQLRFGP